MPLYTSPDDRRSNPFKIFTTWKPILALASLCAQSLASLPLFDSPLALCKSHCEFPRQFVEGISRTPTVPPARWPPPLPPQSTYIVPLRLSSPPAHRRPHTIVLSTSTIMSLTALPTNMQIELVVHLAATSDQPMDDLYAPRHWSVSGTGSV